MHVVGCRYIFTYWYVLVLLVIIIIIIIVAVIMLIFEPNLLINFQNVIHFFSQSLYCCKRINFYFLPTQSGAVQNHISEN